LTLQSRMADQGVVLLDLTVVWRGFGGITESTQMTMNNDGSGVVGMEAGRIPDSCGGAEARSPLGLGIVTVDRELRVLGRNRVARDYCRLGRPGPDDAADCAECLRLLRSAIETGESQAGELLRCAVSDRRHHFALRVDPMSGDDGQIIGAFLTMRELAPGVRPPGESAGRCCRLVGKSERMQEIYSLIEVLAEVDTTVLITGESGTGKELVAEALHRCGPRAEKPLVKVNCAALAENLLESELFGHVRGAFTGAVADKIGRFQRAHGGTIFLDEIGDISPGLQVRLLRVLQEKEIERVGDSQTIRVDVRILAATNQDLLQKVRQGRFREDLYYRLKVVNIELPPLRKRKEDIPSLLDAFRLRFNQQHGRSIRSFSEEILPALLRYDWPGNVRELEHAVEHAAIMCKGGTIVGSCLPPELKGLLAGNRLIRRDEFNQLEALRTALEKAGGNKAKAARLLGVSRQTLYRKLAEHGFDLEDENGELKVGSPQT